MRSRFLAAFSVALGFSVLPAAAQPAPAMERVTFPEAIERAKLRNPTVGQAAQAILRSQALLQQAKSVFHPLLYGFVGTTVLDDARGFDGNITQPRTQTTMNGTASFPFLAASRWAEKNQAADQLGISKISAEETWRQVAVSAAQSYFAVIVAQRQREIAFRNRDTAKALADYSKARLDAGQGSRLNNVRSSQELATAQGLVQAAELLVRAAQEALGVAIFASGAVDANGDPDLPLPVLPPAQDTFLTARPDVRLFSAQLSAADRVVNDYWKSWVPEGTAFFTPQYVTPKGFFEPAKTWRAQFQLQIPLYDRSLIVSKNIRIADRDSAKLRLDSVTVQARSELRLAQEAVTRIEQIVSDSRQAAANADEALRITEVAYRAGATSNIEVVQAQQSARNIEVVAAQAEDRLRQARLDLLVALGQFPAN